MLKAPNLKDQPNLKLHLLEINYLLSFIMNLSSEFYLYHSDFPEYIALSLLTCPKHTGDPPSCSPHIYNVSNWCLASHFYELHLLILSIFVSSGPRLGPYTL